MRSFISLSLLLCGSMTTVIASLNLQPQPIPRPPESNAQTHVRIPAKVFYHDGTLARRSFSTHSRIAMSAGSARLTTFASGPPGACGTTFVDSDFVVALNEIEFYAADHCYENITITYGGKSTEAQIVDMCPSCPEDGLDLTYGLFSYFAPISIGIIYGEWSYQPETTTSVADKPQRTTVEKPTHTQPPSSVSNLQLASQSTHSNTATATSATLAGDSIPANDPQAVNQLNMAGLMTASTAIGK